jgi:DNA phosphorothioation-dependent restriction protein DptG
MPFLADACRADLQCLLNHPQYFLAEKRRFLELYAFLYTSQLALALQSWSVEPQPRPQYFILETEKASRDRPCFNDEGYKCVRQAAHRLFPILSVLNYFNRANPQYPLWRFAHALDKAGERRAACSARIAAFANAFREKRGLEPKTGDDPLRLLVESSRDQFAKGQSRESMGTRYVREFEDHFASPFVDTRGRAGAVLVMRQDHLLLVTNLCIGDDDESILFPELMRRFNARGIFWDQDSQVELVNFYRRVGNVNALSDTGDAVYVARAL